MFRSKRFRFRTSEKQEKERQPF
ncbi:hypothetical protein E2C01_047994 [Portunus trituberculatus]|uniref:Uncharacterized protein n=1 Tax=Portunus trituberculatus TaxID=210409 RepID=A0A5B7G984_PORTR|nr:hypothetical protein [Portunus trituberculatus]